MLYVSGEILSSAMPQADSRPISPFGVSSCLASVVTGKLVDFNYRRRAKKLGFIIDSNKSDNFPNFPLEKSRLEVIWIPTATAIVFVIGYGWALEYNAPLAVPLVLIFILGFTLTACVNVMSTITVDLCPTQSATVTAANNFVRCLVAAGAIAGINPLMDAIGVGPSFTLVGGTYFLSTPLLLLLPRSGAVGRERRQAKRKLEYGK
jgi:MFS family permease